MKTEIFASEFFFSQDSISVDSEPCLSEVNIKQILQRLNEYYDEVLFLCQGNRVAILVVGRSSTILKDVVSEIIAQREPALTSNSCDAINLVFKIASGEKWIEFNPLQIRKLLLRSRNYATDISSLGELLGELLTHAIETNAMNCKAWNVERNYKQVVFEGIQREEFFRYSLN
jgi:hypothetical protein